MKKQLILLLNIAVFAGGTLFYSCKKKDNDNTATPTSTSGAASAQATVNGTTYKATTRTTVPNDTAFLVGTFLPPVDSVNGSYISYTFPYNYKGVSLNAYAFFQENIVGKKDTLSLGFIVASFGQITTGSYKLIGFNQASSNIPPFGIASVGTTNDNFTDSTVTGTLNITQMDMTNNVASGTYNFTDTGTKGSSPATYSVNGQFTNVQLQKF